MTDHGHFHWNELTTRNVAKAKEFYGKTLDWTFEDMAMPDGTYTLCKSGDAMVGGMFEMQGPQFDGMPEQWFACIAVDDVDARLAKLTAEGGAIHRPPFEVPGVGRIAIVGDPNGATSG